MTELASSAPPANALAIADPSMLQLIADSLPAQISYFESGTYVCRFANRRYAESNGSTPDALVGKTVVEIIGETAWDLIQPHVSQAFQGHTVKYVREQTLPDGQIRMVEVNLLPNFNGAGRQAGVFVLINDITEQWRAERVIRDSEERMRKFAQVSNEGILFHSRGIITDVNDALLRMTGHSLSEMLGRNVFDFIPQVLHPVAHEYFVGAREDPYELALLHRNGHEIPIEATGKTMPFNGQSFRMAVVRDITARKAAQRQIEFLAHHDDLTRLPNRAYMRQQLEQMLASARRRNVRTAILFIDLDNFKAVNDSLGHYAGDILLREIAARIRATVRDTDLVSRLGGDEFLVALMDVGGAEDAGAVALKLLSAISPAVTLDGHEATVSPSIGISLFPDDSQSAEELIRHADAAMYRAKDNGRNNYQFFSHAA